MLVMSMGGAIPLGSIVVRVGRAKSVYTGTYQVDMAGVGLLQPPN